jgi:hypothetical protein
MVFSTPAFLIDRLNFVSAEDGCAVAQDARCGFAGGSSPDRTCAALLWRAYLA